MAPRMKVETNTPAEDPKPQAKAEQPKEAPAPTPKPKAPKPKMAVEAPPVAEAPGIKPAPKSAATAAAESAPRVQPTPASKATAQAKPKVTVTTSAPEPEPEQEAAYASPADGPAGPAAAPLPTEPKEGGKGFSNAYGATRGWVHRTFPGHEHAFYGGVGALIVALLTFIIGFWRMLLICVLVFIGVAIGQVLDGDPKIIRTITSLFENDDRR